MMPEKQLKCESCGELFVLRLGELDFLQRMKRPEPKYCPICRRLYRDQMEAKQKAQEDAEWQRRKEESRKKYLKSLNGWPVVSLSEIQPEPEDHPLYVIGNGFDLMHGAKSSYYDFGKTIGKNSPLRFYLEQYLKVDDLWADFEGALAKINVALMSSPYVVDTFLDAMGAYDADAGAADFFAATEMAASPIMAMSTDLMTRFRGWVCRLTTNTNDRPLKDILLHGKVLNFNYTEFVESLYGIDSSRICYIHGCRKTRKGQPREVLILGHQPGASDAEYEVEHRYTGLNLSGNRAQMLYDAQQVTLEHIVQADEALTKNCRQIIHRHQEFFSQLEDIDTVVTIGHSLYPVDWDYFAELLQNSHAKENIKWYFGCHSGSDLDRIQSFMQHFGIRREQVKLFRTDLIHVDLVHSSPDLPVNRKTPEVKKLGLSDDRRWAVEDTEGKVTILDAASRRVCLTLIFSTPISGAVFTHDGMRLLLIAKGIEKGVFLFTLVDGEWKYIRELEGIRNQGVITPRLHRVLRQGNLLVFLYNSRIRKYDIDSGGLVFNRSAKRTFEQTYRGEDLTGKLQKIYQTGFH